MRILMTLILLTLSWSSFANSAPEITVRGLAKYSGQFISLFYVSGKPASFGTAGQDLEVNKVLTGPVIQKIGSDSQSFPAASVPRNGFATFNFVIAVVHDQSEHFLTNLRLNNGAVVRVPVSTAGRAIQDNGTNRKFTAKKFKPIFQLKGNPTINF